MDHNLFRRVVSKFFSPRRRPGDQRLDGVAHSTEYLEIRVVPAREPVPLGSILVNSNVNFFTTEDQGTTTFTVELSQPLIAKNAKKSVSVTVPISSTNTHEGTVSIQEVVFTSASQGPKTVTITGVDDQVEDGDKSYVIEVGKIKAKNAKNYNNKINPRDLTLVNKDNDAPEPGLTFSTTDLTVNDASSGGVSIRLGSRPTANVTVMLGITEGSSQGTISTSSLTFTPTNWNVSQQFFIGMYMEGLHDGDQPFEISVDMASTDPDYDELPTEFISVINHDVDPLEVSVPGRYSGSYSVTTFTEGLPNLPPLNGLLEFFLQDGLVSVTAFEDGTGTYNGDEVTFTIDGGATFTGPMTFTGQITENQDQILTISGVWVFAPISSPEATGTWTVTGPIPDVPGFEVVPNSNLHVTEGESQDFLVRLNTQPASDVEISFVLSQGTGEAQLSTSSLFFTPDNWNIPQTLTVTGVQDQIADGNQDFVFIARVFTDDSNYFGVPSKSLNVSVIDSGVVVNQLDGFYEGTFEGSVTFLGQTTLVGGLVAYEISGDQVTVSEPATVVGAIDQGVSNFSPDSGPFAGAVFTGSYVTNPDGSITATGTWSLGPGLEGSGTWTATRPPLTS